MAAGNGAYSGTAQNLGNSIANVTEYLTSKMDELIVQESKTAGMVADPALVQALGRSGSIKVATMETTGLGNYDKVLGYPRGGAKLTWQTLQCTHDRAISVTVDRRDTLETSGMVTAAAVMANEMREQVIPEVDATRFADLYAALYAQNSANSNVVAEAQPTKANIAGKLIEAIDSVSNVTGDEENMTLYVNATLKPLVDTATEITLSREINAQGTTVETRKRTFNGVPVVFVPAARMNTTITLKDGFTNALSTAGDLDTQDPTKYGFAAGALPIWFTVLGRGVANGVTVINQPKIITADVNQQYDGDTFMYRIFHDLIVPKNKCAAAYMSVKTSG